MRNQSGTASQKLKREKSDCRIFWGLVLHQVSHQPLFQLMVKSFLSYVLDGAKFKYVSSSDSIMQQMINAGSGSRGIVFGSYGPGQPGHVFNVVNQNGVIRFLDGQTGKPADLS